MMKITLFAVLLTLAGLRAHAQNPESNTAKNTVFVEALGNGMFGSLNYERQLTAAPGLSLRAGVGFYSEQAFYLSIPVGINYLIPVNQQRNGYLDMGMGVTWAREDARISPAKTPQLAAIIS